MEQIVFPVPNICEFLTPESKLDAYQTCERDDQNSKVTDWFVNSLFLVGKRQISNLNQSSQGANQDKG